MEGKRGFLRVFADQTDVDVILKNLGCEFGIVRIWFKMFPCVATVQGVIDTLAKVIEEHKICADDIEVIQVGISETSLSHGGAIYERHDVASAQFSLPFSLALRLKNDNDLSLYMDSKLWTDPKVLALAKRVKSYADPKAKGEQNYNTTMEVKLSGGKSVKAFQQYPPGSPLNPVSRDELRKKFRKLAGTVLSESRMDQIIEKVDRLETDDDASELMRLLVK
jgi:2-methylcitrate dehydratase PrpD